MTSRPRCIALSCLVLSLAGCAAPGRDVPEDLSLRISDELQTTLAQQRLQTHAATSAAARVRRTVEVDHKGNFGRLVHLDVEEVRQLRPDGLSQLERVERERAGNAAGTMKEVSLCGLLPVLSEAGSSATAQLTAVAAVGKAFVPLDFGSSYEMGTRYRMSRLQASTKDVCSPRPGDRFTIALEGEMQRKFRGNVTSSNRQVTLSEQLACTVADRPEPASDLHASLTGSYLAVSCRHVGQPAGERTTRHAFVQTWGAYVPLGESSSWQTTRVKFDDVR